MWLGKMRALAALLGAVAAATVEEPRAEPQTGGRVARYKFISLIARDYKFLTHFGFLWT